MRAVLGIRHQGGVRLQGGARLQAWARHPAGARGLGFGCVFCPVFENTLARDERIRVSGCVLCSGFVTTVGCVTKAGRVSRLGHPVYIRGRHPLAGAHSQRMELVRVQIAKKIFFGLTDGRGPSCRVVSR